MVSEVTDRLDSTGLTPEQKQKLRDAEAILLDPEWLDAAICDVGPNGCAIYDYYALVHAFSQNENMTANEAQEWVEFNTIRALYYMPQPRPQVRGNEEEEEEE